LIQLRELIMSLPEMKASIRTAAMALTLVSLAFSFLAQAQTGRTSTGVVVADRSVTLAAKIVGRIEAVQVDEGDTVDAGHIEQRLVAAGPGQPQFPDQVVARRRQWIAGRRTAPGEQ